VKQDRIKKIEQCLIESETISLTELCKMFNVSINTIRRDVAVLESKGIVRKVYGGITLNTAAGNTIPFIQRTQERIDEKVQIGKFAAPLVSDGDTIFIDSGTTTINIIPHLASFNNLTIITNSLNTINEASKLPNVNVISTGGILQRKTNSFAGITTVDFLDNLNIDKAFMATTGISIEKGVTNTTYLEAEIKKIVASISTDIIIMADHTKFDKISFMSYCPLGKINYLITDLKPSQKYMDFFNQNNIECICTT